MGYFVIDVESLQFFKDKKHYQSGGKPKKVIPITVDLRPTSIRPKSYSSYGIVYNFALEQVLDYGPVFVAKFGR